MHEVCLRVLHVVLPDDVEPRTSPGRVDLGAARGDGDGCEHCARAVRSGFSYSDLLRHARDAAPCVQFDAHICTKVRWSLEFDSAVRYGVDMAPNRCNSQKCLREGLVLNCPGRQSLQVCVVPSGPVEALCIRDLHRLGTPG